VSRALNRGVKAFVLAAAVELTGAPAFAQSAPFYGEHLSGPFGLFTEAGERICTIELMSQYNQLRENFVLNASDCPEPFASAQRWGLERGMGTGRQQIAFWSGGFRPAWRGAVPGRDAAFWIGEASTGERFVLLPESEGPLRLRSRRIPLSAGRSFGRLSGQPAKRLSAPLLPDPVPGAQWRRPHYGRG